MKLIRFYSLQRPSFLIYREVSKSQLQKIWVIQLMLKDKFFGCEDEIEVKLTAPFELEI